MHIQLTQTMAVPPPLGYKALIVSFYMPFSPVGGVLSREFATYVRPATRAPIIGAKFAQNPPIMAKYWVILKENFHFLPQV